MRNTKFCKLITQIQYIESHSISRKSGHQKVFIKEVTYELVLEGSVMFDKREWSLAY